jgi:hypothetical protein
MSYPNEIILTKDQIDFIVKASGEKNSRRAFRMFCRAMRKEGIRLNKMPLLVDKLIAREKEGKKE